MPVSLARLLPDEPPLGGGADPIRVLIVEDDEDYREIVGDELSSAALPMAIPCSGLSIPPPRPMSSSSTGGFRIFRASTCYRSCAGTA